MSTPELDASIVELLRAVAGLQVKIQCLVGSLQRQCIYHGRVDSNMLTACKCSEPGACKRKRSFEGKDQVSLCNWLEAGSRGVRIPSFNVTFLLCFCM